MPTNGSAGLSFRHAPLGQWDESLLGGKGGGFRHQGAFEVFDSATSNYLDVSGDGPSSGKHIIYVR